MAAKTFVVKRIGDRYVTVPKDEHPACDHVAFVGWGGLVLMLGLERRGVIRAAMTLGGTALIARGVLGRERYYGMLKSWKEKAKARRDLLIGNARRAPSYQNDTAGRAGQLPADEVDEASMESFPASDPPGKMAGQGTL